MTLRVALITEATGGGAARHLSELAGGLIREGHCVHVIYSRRRAEQQVEEGLARLAGLNTAVVEMRREPHPYDAISTSVIHRYLRQHGPFDIIHGHSSKGGALARLAALGLPGARVYTPHCFRTLDPTLHLPARAIYSGSEWMLSHLSHAVIAVSPDELRHAIALGIQRRKLHLVFNGVNEPDRSVRAAVRAQLGLRADEVCVGFLARFVPQKAPERMIEVARQLGADLPPFRIVMVGGGPLERILRTQVDKAGLGDRITFVSGVIGPKAICAFDVFALPSAYEGLPYVLLDAAAMGLPIVATQVGGSTSVIAEGRNGFIIANWDCRAFATQLSCIIRDGELRSRMGQESREIGKIYSLDRMVKATVEVYSAAIEQRSNSRASYESENPLASLETGPSQQSGHRS